tara:strand:+ start:90 stop:413 length:324 start_codon:yes stop_codon:yes gene_type:complete
MLPEQTTDLINLARYPIHQNGAARDQIIADVQQQLADTGCAILKKFLTPKAIERITHEADNVSAFAHKSYNRTNAYFSADDPALISMIHGGGFLIGPLRLFRQTILT